MQIDIFTTWNAQFRDELTHDEFSGSSNETKIKFKMTDWKTRPFAD